MLCLLSFIENKAVVLLLWNGLLQWLKHSKLCIQNVHVLRVSQRRTIWLHCFVHSMQCRGSYAKSSVRKIHNAACFAVSFRVFKCWYELSTSLYVRRRNKLHTKNPKKNTAKRKILKNFMLTLHNTVTAAPVWFSSFPSVRVCVRATFYQKCTAQFVPF